MRNIKSFDFHLYRHSHTHYGVLEHRVLALGATTPAPLSLLVNAQGPEKGRMLCRH